MVFSSVDRNTPPQTTRGTGNSGTVIMETDTVSYDELMRLLEFGMIAPYRTNNTAPRNEEYTTHDPFVFFHNIITCTLLPVKDTLCSFRYDIVRIHHHTVLLWIIRIVCVRVCVSIGPPLPHTTAIPKTEFIMVASNQARLMTKAL